MNNNASCSTYYGRQYDSKDPRVCPRVLFVALSFSTRPEECAKNIKCYIYTYFAFQNARRRRRRRRRRAVHRVTHQISPMGTHSMSRRDICIHTYIHPDDIEALSRRESPAIALQAINLERFRTICENDRAIKCRVFIPISPALRKDPTSDDL